PGDRSRHTPRPRAGPKRAAHRPPRTDPDRRSIPGRAGRLGRRAPVARAPPPEPTAPNACRDRRWDGRSANTPVDRSARGVRRTASRLARIRFAPRLDCSPPDQISRRRMSEPTTPFRAKGLFAGLTSDDVDGIVRVGEPVTFEPDRAIFESGDDGDAMYVITEGEAHVDVGGRSQDRKSTRL